MTYKAIPLVAQDTFTFRYTSISSAAGLFVQVVLADEYLCITVYLARVLAAVYIALGEFNDPT